jgi:hypothetical protein
MLGSLSKIAGHSFQEFRTILGMAKSSIAAPAQQPPDAVPTGLYTVGAASMIMVKHEPLATLRRLLAEVT